jgi:hypothetical protein
MKQQWSNTDTGKPKNSEKKTCSSVASSATNPTWTVLDAKPKVSTIHKHFNRIPVYAEPAVTVSLAVTSDPWQRLQPDQETGAASNYIL